MRSDETLNWSRDTENKGKGMPGVVVRAYNPSYLGGRVRRIEVQDQPGQKHETLSEK
jgi:hypothetical protein